ncbi:LapA family protein [Aquisphaera insulae]|uniref:LapA family protein n=1 Tax=Aquisphaera insulae TaxID=2712864 RepID=UPI0013ED443B|nr:LapA family protein [Aquisphaera insulae]
MAYQYKRRKPSILRNFWVYRRLVGVAVLLGVLLWFVWVNDALVTVAFPFRLGELTSRLGVVILLSAVFGSLMTLLAGTIVVARRRIWGGSGHVGEAGTAAAAPAEDDLPPPDYAAKTGDGFTSSKWTG